MASPSAPRTCPSAQQLQHLMAEQLAEAEAEALEAHVEVCATCQQALERLLVAAGPFPPGPGEKSTGDNPLAADAGEEFLRRLEQRRFGKTLAGTEAADETWRPVEFLGAEHPVLADYEILGVLGRGGMGVVYQAWQSKLKRVVALKMMLAPGHARADDLARFRIEVEATARLQHPNIVQVHEVGEQDGRPFLVMEFVEGGSLAEKLRGAPLPPRQAARLVETLAGAMHYAHQRGILHRDLKPANILVQPTEDTADTAPMPSKNSPPLAVSSVVKITDFGLAKLTIGGSDQTHAGSIVGTPSYMAPEQAAGKTKDISTAVDTYALGAILYELLTGQPPFRGDTAAATVQLVLSAQPLSPRRLQPNVPGDLQTICMKCLERDPRQRYASAADLAEDLRRFQEDEPIRARPSGLWKLAWRWARRRPAVAALAMVIVLSATGLLVGGLWYQARLEQSLVDVGHERDRANDAKTDADQKQLEAKQARNDAEQKRLEAEEQREEARHNLYLAQIPLAQRAWEAGRVERLQELLESVRPRLAQQKDLRHFEWYYLRNLCHTDLLTLTGHADPVTAVAFRWDGQQLASASADGTIKLWDVSSGKELRTLKGHTKKVTAVAFRPDGKQLASASADKTVRLWDADNGQAGRTLEGHSGYVYHVVFSPCGRWLASASVDKTIKLWDASTGKELRTFKGHTDGVTAVVFSHNNRWLASAGKDRTVRLWDLASDKEPRILEGHSGWVYSVAFSPDDRSLASSSFDNTVRIWDTTSGQEQLKLLGHSGQIRCVVFSPDGKRLASAGFDQTVRIWDAAKGNQLFPPLRGHVGNVNSVVFHPDGRRLASAGEDRSVKVWDDQQFRTAQQHTVGPVTALVFSPDCQHLVSGGGDNLVRVWDLATWRQLAPFQGHKGKVYALALTSDGKRLASGGGDKMVRVWDTATTQQLWLLKGHSARVAGVAFSPDDTRLASAGFDGMVKVWNWDNEGGKELLNIKAHAGRVTAVVFSPDGKKLASSGDDKMVRLWDAESGKPLGTLDGHRGWVYCVAFSPNGRWLASASEDGTIKLWNMANGKESLTLEGHDGRVNGVVFSRDSQRLASAGFFEKAVKIWDLTRGQELLSLKHNGFVSAVAFSPDGCWLASSGAGPAVRLWNAKP
jgi:WD40 repeat protein/serine/threonine protein kinase